MMLSYHELFNIYNLVFMQKNGKIIREVTEEDLLKQKPFSYFGWEGNDSFSFLSISDAYWEVSKLIYKKMGEACNRNDITDTYIYPLFFNYRHSIETFLKYLYFKYGSNNDNDRKGYLQKGHDLQKLWEELNPILKNVRTTEKIADIKSYILEINRFDQGSFTMRYPINKNLASNKSVMQFDFICFAEGMNGLCESLRQLDYDLSNRCTEFAKQEEVKLYINMIEKYKNAIEEFIEILKSEKQSESTSFCKITFSEIELEEVWGKSKREKFFDNRDSDLIVLLCALFYGGQGKHAKIINLSTDPCLKKKEFVWYCNKLLKQENLCFGEQIDNCSQFPICSKSASVLLKYIDDARNILLES